MRNTFLIILCLLFDLAIIGQDKVVYRDFKVYGNIVVMDSNTGLDSSTMRYLYVDSISIGGHVITPDNDIFSDVLPDSISLNPTSNTAYSPYRFFADTNNNTFTFTNDIDGSSLQNGRELWGRGYNDFYDTVHEGTVVTGITGLRDEAVLVKYRPGYDYTVNKMFGVVTNDILNGKEGEVTTYGRTHGIDTRQYGRNKFLYATNDTTDDDGLTSIRPAWPEPAFLVGITLDSLEDGSIYTTYRHDGIFYQFDGSCIQEQDGFVVVEDGHVYYDVELKGGGDLPVQLHSQVINLNCTSGSGVGGMARVELTQGTITNSVLNTVYVTLDIDGNAILKATTGYPQDSDSVFAMVSYVGIWDAYKTGVYGPKSHQLTIDAINHNDRGKLPYVDERLRVFGASYEDGVAFSSIVNHVPDPDSVSFTHTSGVGYQLHRHEIPSYSIKERGIYIANHPTNPDTVVYDLSDPELLQEVDGTTLEGTWFNWVVWGSINKDSSDYKLFINLPNGSYSTAAEAISDADNTAVTTIDKDMRGTGFLICRLPYQHRTQNSGEYYNLATTVLGLQGIDLRGVSPGYNLSSSGVPASATFNDNEFVIYNITDNTKVLKYNLSPIPTGTQITLSAPTKNGTIFLKENKRSGTEVLTASETEQTITFSSTLEDANYTLYINAYSSDGLTVFPVRGVKSASGFNITVNYDCTVEYIAIQ